MGRDVRDSLSSGCRSRWCRGVRPSGAALVTTLVVGHRDCDAGRDADLGPGAAKHRRSGESTEAGVTKRSTRNATGSGTRPGPGVLSPMPTRSDRAPDQGARGRARVPGAQLGAVVANIAATIGSLFVMLFALFFMLRDGDSIASIPPCPPVPRRRTRAPDRRCARPRHRQRRRRAAIAAVQGSSAV